MADYFARVELHGADWPTDYVTLHSALSKHGFTNCVPTNGALKRLPSGFYFASGPIDNVQRVAEVVKGCADATGYSNEVLVTRSDGGFAYLNRDC